METGTN